MTKARRSPPADLKMVISALGECRSAMIALRAGAPARSLVRASADQMVANIDELAWILTGERDLFMLKGHGTDRGRV